MIIFGSGSDEINLGPLPEEYCSTCEKDRGFSRVLIYQYDHVWYIFARSYKPKYYKLCDICRRGPQLDRKEVEQEIGGNPIPFMRRFGCVVFFLVFIGLAFAWAILDPKKR